MAIAIDDDALVRMTFADSLYWPGPDDEAVRPEWYEYRSLATNDPTVNRGQFPAPAFRAPQFFSWLQCLVHGASGERPDHLSFDARTIDRTNSPRELLLSDSVVALQGPFRPRSH